VAAHPRPGPTGPPPPGSRTVRTDDGVPLHVEFAGNPAAPLTVVLTHGFTARLAEWGPQVEAIGDRARVVLWDQRGHGRSGWTRLTRATVDRTGQDLAEVLDAVAPTGPVVLGGHSLGGMTIMALARRRPELFGDRVAGVFLLATSAGGLVQGGIVGRALGLVRRLHLLRLWLLVVQALAPLLERYRRRGTLVGRWFTRRYLFGRRDATRRQVREVQNLLEETPYPVVMAFYATFLEHDETAALPVLGRVPVTIVGASDDRLTPVEHSRRMAALIGGDVELVVVPGAGHSVNLTRPEVVDAALLDLLDRVAARQAGGSRQAG
jgi:pimeloyl-ACP methyl ester carboxylesterase